MPPTSLRPGPDEAISALEARLLPRSEETHSAVLNVTLHTHENVATPEPDHHIYY